MLLVHPGGPFWVNKDDGAWSIPKGELTDDEDPLVCAQREFAEETGQPIEGPFVDLPPARQSSGKVVYAFAAQRDLDSAQVRSNTFELEWPRGSGVKRTFPEIDKAEWLSVAEARRKILRGQQPLLDDLVRILGDAPLPGDTGRKAPNSDSGPNQGSLF